MNSLFTKISKILGPGVKLEVYSNLNQHLVNTQNVILWNDSIQTIDDDTYEKFKIAVKKNKTCSFYTLNQTLPFHDFCIALLCSVDYTLNHKTVPTVLERSYTFAWRGLVILSEVGDESVRLWLKDRLNGRNLNGYTSSLGVNRDNVVETKRRPSHPNGTSKFAIDETKIVRACSSKIPIRHITLNTPIVLLPTVQRSSNTPEGQLVSLRNTHNLLLNKLI